MYLRPETKGFSISSALDTTHVRSVQAWFIDLGWRGGGKGAVKLASVDVVDGLDCEERGDVSC